MPSVHRPAAQNRPRPSLAFIRHADLPWRPAILFPLLGILCLALAGTSHAFWPFPATPEPVAEPGTTPQAVLAAADQDAKTLEAHIDQLTQQLLDNLSEPDLLSGPMGEGLTVCSLVELKKLTRTSSFGRYLAEELLDAFQQHGFPVNELRQTTDIGIQEQRGEYALSRNPALIRPRVASGATLTGTYTLTDHQVFVNARILDARTGLVLASGSTRLSRNPLLDGMLADRVSAQGQAAEEIYLKRLEM